MRKGAIALDISQCTSCMVCVRECPLWCITLHADQDITHKNGRKTTVNILKTFTIDWSVCMSCGICVKMCPHDALFWSSKLIEGEQSRDGLVHNKEKLHAHLEKDDV